MSVAFLNVKERGVRYHLNHSATSTLKFQALPSMSVVIPRPLVLCALSHELKAKLFEEGPGAIDEE